VSKKEISEAYFKKNKDLVRAIKTAKANIEKFHKSNVIKKRAVIITQKECGFGEEFRP